jgi:TctA family transporter
VLQSGGDPAAFVSNPISAVCLVLAALMLVMPIVQDARRGRKSREAAPREAS